MNLTRFDRQNEFYPMEIACLLSGMDPVEAVRKEKIANDIELIKNSMLNAFKFFMNYKVYCNNEKFFDRCLLSLNLEKIIRPEEVDSTKCNLDINPFMFLSIKAKEEVDDSNTDNESDFLFSVDDEYYNYFSSNEFDDEIFLKTKFSRSEIQRWLIANGYASIYQFSRDDVADISRKNILYDLDKSKDIVDSYIDPEDLPSELSIANIAFRAITNGNGDKSATFKNRLIAYLEKEYKSLSKEAKQRIATVANSDKTPGRR